MAILTLKAAPAGRTPFGSICQVMTFGNGSPVTRRTVEVKTAADCAAAFEAFAADIGRDAATLRKLADSYASHASKGDVPGAAIHAMIHNGHGRKPNGYNALKLERFIEPQQVAA